VGVPRVVLGSDIPQLLALGVIWGVTFPVARLGVVAGVDPFLLVTLDLLLAAAVMAPFALRSGIPRPPVRSLLESAGLGALLIGGINLPLYWGLRFATGGTAAIVYATSPLISVVVLVVLGSSTGVHRRQAAALAVGLGGVLLLGFATTGAALVAGVGALSAFALGATCQGVGAVLVGRARPRGEHQWGLLFQFVGGAAAAMAVLPLLTTSYAVPLTAPAIGSILYVGVLSMVVGYTLFFGLIRRFGAVRANQVTFLNPVVALVVGVLVLGELFQPLEAVALLAILVALLLLQPSVPRPALQPAAEPTRTNRVDGSHPS
jgi:drug/metabolite transporter (DMT)-like permease